MKKTKWAAGSLAAALAVMMSASTMVAFSAGNSSYSYLAGRQRSVSRNELYEQAAKMEDEAEREAFLIEHGIGDTEYSEEAAASYSYVSGRERGAGYRSSDDTETGGTQAGYSYTAGQQRGSSYRH